MKKIFITLTAIIFCVLSLSIRGYCQQGETDYKSEWEEELIYVTEHGKAKDIYSPFYEDGVSKKVLPAKYLKYFKEEKNAVLSFTYKKNDDPNLLGNSTELCIILYFGADDYYEYKLDMSKRETVCVSEILEKTKIENPQKLIGVVFQQPDEIFMSMVMTDHKVSAEVPKPSNEMLEQQNALTAYYDLCDMFMLYGVPNNYAGEYIDGSQLVIMICDDNHTPYRYILEKHDCVQLKRTKKSYKELQALFDKVVEIFADSKLLESTSINVMKNCVDAEINALKYIKLTKEERDGLFIDGVNYTFVNSSSALNSLIASCENGACGWNKVDGKRYYIKSDGTFATKSTTIDGIRYKFTSDGVCRGKYTGWTKSDSGRRYWKDGKLIKNKWLKTKSGKRYYADEKGYVKIVI